MPSRDHLPRRRRRATSAAEQARIELPLAELGDAGSDPADPEVARVDSRQLLAAGGEQGPQGQQQPLGLGGAEGDQAHGGTELIGDPAVEIGLDHIRRVELKAAASVGKGGWARSSGASRWASNH